MYFKIGNQDFSSYVKSMRVDMEVLLSDQSGRNAAGDNLVDIVNRKDKVEIVFRPLFQEEMEILLSALAPFVLNVSYLNPRTGALKTINCYINTPSPEYYYILDDKILYKPLSVNFIEN